ncbi:MAG: DUF2948 family protein [Neomegalonema sp.]|nr:DUF2948 family protein [Neomegalonema sp.]
MTEDRRDASFMDDDKPLRLRALDGEDLTVISALMQDAVVQVKDIAWLPGQRRFVLVANRYRWEAPAREERVRVGLHFDNVARARVKGVDLGDGEAVLALLAILFEPDDPADPASGTIYVTAAGGAEFALEVEALEASASDMTKPWSAKGRPAHEMPEE